MSYSYQSQRPRILTPEMQPVLITIALVARAGCKRSLPAIMNAADLMRAMPGEVSDSWDQMAVIDRLCELGFLRDVTRKSDKWQYRIFTWSGP